ncbi:MAG: OmpA family protein [Lentimicrobiaceae bacterium]|jgi:outer membrane protein OmpA-like peptidoglycan-associated protein
MKLITNFKKGPRKAWSPYTLIVKGVVISAFMLIGINASLQAQETEYTRPSWLFGVAGGANFNFYNGSTHQLDANFAPPVTFHEGQGIGLFVAPLIEYHRPDSRLGFMLQGGLDNRQGKFDQVKAPCNCPADLETDISYVTIEPSLRLAPFKSDFYLYAGPRFAYNISKSYTYKLGLNPAYPDQEPTADVTGDLSDVNDMQISMQVGAGYDIQLSSTSQQTQWVLSPFVSFQPYFGQTPRSIETLNITTIRAGVALKLGRGREIPAPAKVEEIAPVVVVAVVPEVKFMVNSPKNVPAELKVTEVFPIRNYVFFDLGSKEIPKRYVLLQKDEVKDFREDQLESSKPKNIEGRSDRQMVVYYNILNILGDRMVKNPSTTVTLVGSSREGSKDGREMAESINTYLVNVFGISGSRITVKGQSRPDVPSEQPGGSKELVLLREGDRRVSIESKSPELLMEFQSGPDASLKPVVIATIPEAPVESYITFESIGATEAYKSWRLEIRDEKGTVQNFGPYYQDSVSIPTKSILGTRPSGDYKVKMVADTKAGRIEEKESTVHMVLWTPPQTKEGMRFSILYEFNKSKATDMYEKYLSEIVTPKIPSGGTVIIQGHTDIIGGEENNVELSVARANDVKGILEKSLTKAGRSDVKFQVNGFGEDEKSAPFENKYPEDRFYNRTVIIDIIPVK